MHYGKIFGSDYLEKHKVDDHHIFPQNYLKKSGDGTRANVVLNRTLIDKKTNIRISDKAPSKYSKEILKELGEQSLRKILSSHAINFEKLASDDFDGFLNQRALGFMELLRESIGKEVPNAPTTSTLEEELFEEEDGKTDPRDKHSADVVNAHPSELLEDMPKQTEELFAKFTQSLLKHQPACWWKANTRKVVFWSPEKVFASIRLSKTGLHFVLFTDGKPLAGVDPIVQKDRGGELWGRIKFKAVEDLEKGLPTILESLERLKKACAEGRATAWWAMTNKEKVA